MTHPCSKFRLCNTFHLRTRIKATMKNTQWLRAFHYCKFLVFFIINVTSHILTTNIHHKEKVLAVEIICNLS